jgi:hypothetical protein
MKYAREQQEKIVLMPCTAQENCGGKHHIIKLIFS